MFGQLFKLGCQPHAGAIASLFMAAALHGYAAVANAATTGLQERMVEQTFESKKAYADPFNDVDVDVVFERNGRFWRVPTFWRGGSRWTVRFAPPSPGEYAYHLESTDRGNPDLNGHDGKVTIAAYTGPNDLLRHGLLHVSANHRYFEHEDGTPFYWLGDTWWTGLSDRLSWEEFQKLTADRKAKGFTLVQIVAGLVPPEEQAPIDPGFHNEGGFVWDAQFNQINPQYFDYADRRLFHLLDAGMVPAVVGGWYDALGKMGVARMKKHWRYIIARYGAYPAFWILGGEVMDPPENVARSYPKTDQAYVTRGWTEVARYIRETDPYHHPLTVHEAPPPYDTALQDETLTDFDLFQSGHYGWPSIAVEVSQLDQHYSRTGITKPIVEGEIGYEKLGETHFEDFQRAAFWLAMLNGAAGHTYGANGTWEAYTADKPLHRLQWSFLTWEEGMNLPGSYQVGLDSKLLRRYPWWRFAPHPEWVSPHGTTLLEPHPQINGFAYGTYQPCTDCEPVDRVAELESNYAAQEWKDRKGTFRLPYAAGIAGQVRFIYIPAIGLMPPNAPTIHALEPDVRYQAFWWEPSTGTRIDLGAVKHPAPGKLLFDSEAGGKGKLTRKTYRATQPSSTATFLLPKSIQEANGVVSVNARSTVRAEAVLRFEDCDNYLAAIYSPEEKALYFRERSEGRDGRPLGKTVVGDLAADSVLDAEVRDNRAAAALRDGQHTYATPIVDVSATPVPGGMGVLETSNGRDGMHLRVYGSPALIQDETLDRRLYDAKGVYRGDLAGTGTRLAGPSEAGWEDFGRHKSLLLDAYRPDRLPTTGDWLLVLQNEQP